MFRQHFHRIMIDELRKRWVRFACWRADDRRQMDDRIMLADKALHERFVHHIAFYEIEMRVVCQSEQRCLTVQKRINHCNLVSLSEKLLRENRADVTRATRYQYAFH